ncbi:hypothetical protein, partial [Pseudomonas syringae group genomosp. 7]|uniref:hypothetical protein n=1 Tax=Pseudomonas syringae group genomosp. 7 TaxID=251699 RepID=UPI00376FBE56
CAWVWVCLGPGVAFSLRVVLDLCGSKLSACHLSLVLVATLTLAIRVQRRLRVPLTSTDEHIITTEQTGLQLGLKNL